jgi:NADH-quinone oxidoreductase subunit M
MEHLISAVIFLPLLGALIALFLPERAAKVVCTLFALITLVVSVPLATGIGKAIPFGKGAADAKAPSVTFFDSSILPHAFEEHGIEAGAKADAVLNRMKAEKESNVLAERLRVETDPARRSALESKRALNTLAVERAVSDYNLALGSSYDERYHAFVSDVSDLYDASNGTFARSMKFTEHMTWIPRFSIHYLVALDGLSLPLVLLTTLLTLLCLIYSWQFDYDKPIADRRPLKAFYILFLILETGLVGVFCSLDFFLFFVFWEIVLLPSYFLIGIWGGENRNYASIKFFIYTLVGSVTMLIAMLALYFHFTPHTFNILTLIQLGHEYGGTALFSTRFQAAIFLLLFLGFAVKVPVFPFHTWLPDAHVQAPTAFSVMLAGVMLKMGGYGLFRVSFPMCHDAAVTHTMIWALGALGVINIVYGALVAMGQSDFKSLVAYSSVSHMGYVILGLAAATAAGLDGGAMQMVNHGLSSAGMFFIVGIIYDRAHHRDLNRFGGIALQMPRYFGFSLVILFASLGLPGLNGFISEAFVFLGAWESTLLPKWMTVTATLGILFGAAYILWTIRRVFLGPLTVEKYKHFPDLNWRETVALAPLAILCVVIGVYPKLILEDMGLEAAMQSISGTLGIR